MQAWDSHGAVPLRSPSRESAAGSMVDRHPLLPPLWIHRHILASWGHASVTGHSRGERAGSFLRDEHSALRSPSSLHRNILGTTVTSENFLPNLLSSSPFTGIKHACGEDSSHLFLFYSLHFLWTFPPSKFLACLILFWLLLLGRPVLKQGIIYIR